MNTELTDNEHIAIYMGMHECDCGGSQKPKHYKYGDMAWQVYSVDSLRYHESWDWLMEVIEKIFKETPNEFVYDEYNPQSPLAELMIYDKIEIVHAAVVAYIKNPIQR